MKALIICPAERKSVEPLAESAPLAVFSIFGKELICLWIEHLVEKGARSILILAPDRPDQVRRVTGDGSRWGINVEIVPETRELSVEEAREKYQKVPDGWLAPPHDLVLMDHLPSCPQNTLFQNYASLFLAAQNYFPLAHLGSHVGLREIKNGVWVGLNARIASTAKLIAPCWISDHAHVGDRAIVGPWAVVGNRAFIDAQADISHSMVGVETFVGKFTTLKNSLAMGSTLINWQSGSHVRIVDSFLLSPLKTVSHFSKENFIGRLAAIAAIVATSPLALAWIGAVKIRGQNVFQPRQAFSPVAGRTFNYYEFAHTNGFWRRWPQLWSIVRGDFCWVGNRPLNAQETAKLKTDFEKLWLNAPIGLLSYADAMGCTEEFSDAAIAHAAFYSARRNWKIDFAILLSVLKHLCLPKKVPATAPQSLLLPPQQSPVPQSISSSANRRYELRELPKDIW